MFKRRSFSLVGMGLLLISTLLSVFIPYIVKNLIDNTELHFSDLITISSSLQLI